MEKEKCDCGAVAVWCYMPGYSGGGNPHHCEDCVPRGCSCEWRWVATDAYFPPNEAPDLPEGIEGKNWKWVVQEKTDTMESKPVKLTELVTKAG